MRNKFFAAIMVCVFSAIGTMAADGMYMIEELYAKNTALDGKHVIAKGKVIKISNGIMGKDWVHLQDGSKTAGMNKVIFTTPTGKANVAVGEMVIATGKLKANVDLGAGYFYKVLVEESTFQK